MSKQPSKKAVVAPLCDDRQNYVEWSMMFSCLVAVFRTSEREVVRYQLIPSPLVFRQTVSVYFLTVYPAIQWGHRYKFRAVVYHGIMTKKMVSAKVAERTAERLDDLADKEGISRSQAIDRMLKQGLDVEHGDVKVVPVATDGGTALEDKMDNLGNRIDEQNKVQNRQIASAIVGLLWIAIHVTFSIPTILTIATGTPLAILVVYITLRANEWGFSNE